MPRARLCAAVSLPHQWRELAQDDETRRPRRSEHVVSSTDTAGQGWGCSRSSFPSCARTQSLPVCRRRTMYRGEAAMNASGGAVQRANLTDVMTFNATHVLSMASFSLMMVVSSVGNIAVLCTLLRRSKRSRINLMLTHLAVSDLLVTFVLMPMEIAWNYTVSWRAGPVACHIMAFFRVFGFYLSSAVLVCITVDRYFAVLKPMSLKTQSARRMLAAAWTTSIVSSLPQVAIFHLESPEGIPEFVQCVAFHSSPTAGVELAYSFFSMLMMYGIPLLVIVFCYVSILMEICRRSKETSTDTFRRSSLGYLGRAKARTLKMTIIIVLVFIVCWTPYYVMSVWYWLDNDSAEKVNPVIQKVLFLFASTNTCMNPIVYGLFTLRTCGVGRTQQLSDTSATGPVDRPARIAAWRRKREAVRRELLMDLVRAHKPRDAPTAR
ncbi:adipokinetic hormone/corazonin-related peptide receptor variant I-like [Bacillus rossius redtenbacheri]|uniref:adipokinetic hormone/corazonin-related peptide receptor variant I-like n=1 Tax=Bacillus rossius redtenbacheri TaxID=93214 RepID=UPI002FDD5667